MPLYKAWQKAYQSASTRGDVSTSSALNVNSSGLSLTITSRHPSGTSHSHSKAKTTDGEKWFRVCRSWSERFFDGAVPEFHEHLESHRNDPTSINDLELALLKHDPGLVRNVATALYHVFDHVNARTSTTTGPPRRQSRRRWKLIALTSGGTNHSQQSQQSRSWLTCWRHQSVVNSWMR